MEPYGSFVSNLFTKWGDLDISIELKNGSYISSAGRKHKQSVLAEVLQALRRRGNLLLVQPNIALLINLRMLFYAKNIRKMFLYIFSLCDLLAWLIVLIDLFHLIFEIQWYAQLVNPKSLEIIILNKRMQMQHLPLYCGFVQWKKKKTISKY